MRSWKLLVIVFFPLLGSSQAFQPSHFIAQSSETEYYINLFLKTDQVSVKLDKVTSLLSKLEDKRSTIKNDRDFLHFAFTKTHQKIFKHFATSCSFSELFTTGNYNCLTATALYAIVLDHFNINYKIIETNYHIFIIAQTTKGDVLFEATDPLNGFVASPHDIEQRITSYQKNAIDLNTGDKTNYAFHVSLFDEVTIEQLPGLMYYNFSIQAYNHKMYVSAIEYLDQARRYYQSPRFEEFTNVIMLTLINGNISPTEKEIGLKKIQSLRKKVPVLASAN